MHTGIRFLVAAGLAAFPLAAVAAPTVRTNVIATVRSCADLDCRALFKLAKGETVEVTFCTPRPNPIWCRIQTDEGDRGWVPGKNLAGGSAKAQVTPFVFKVKPSIDLPF